MKGTSSHLPALVLGAAVGLGALGLTTSSAHAAINVTAPSCQPRPTADVTLVSSAQASLVWRVDGTLALEPIDAPLAGTSIWSSPPGQQLCFTTSGTYQVKDAAGAVVWSMGTNSYQPGNEAQYVFKPTMTGCTLGAGYTKYKYQQICAFTGSCFTTSTLVVSGHGSLWSTPMTCPVFSESNVVNGDGWCLDNSQERVLARTPTANLIWRTHGGLNLVTTGIRGNQQIWGSGTYGIGRKICFENDGRLTIYDANDAVAWRSSAVGGPTTTDYAIGLDGCNFHIDRLDGGADLFAWNRRCPQELLTVNQQTYTTGATEQVLVESGLAQLVLDTGGTLRLRARAGGELWSSTTSGAQASFDGDLRLTRADIGTAFSTGLVDNGQGGTTLEISGCELSIRDAAGTVRWVRGSTTCEQRSLPLDGQQPDLVAWDATTDASVSGTSTLLRSDEATLVWQSDGNLVLYTTGGYPLWATATNSAITKLALQGDGNLVIRRFNPITGGWNASWTSGTVGSNRRLELVDNCTLRITDGTTVLKTFISSCEVKLYDYERNEGNDTFGTTLASELTANQVNGTKRLDTATRFLVKIFGYRATVVSATGYNAGGVTGASVAVVGESTPALNVGYSKEFFKQTKTVMVGFVPVKLTAAATGDLGVSVTTDTSSITVTPSAGLHATVSAGIGAGTDGFGASAGVKGSLTILELAFPITMKIFNDGGTTKFQVQGDLDLTSLSGSLAVYAEAHLLFVSLEWSFTFFKWTGIELDKTLFAKTSAF